MDDIAIGTNASPKGQAFYKQIVHEFLDIFEQHSYFLKASKCEFEKEEMEFLGFQVERGTVWIDPSKLEGIINWPQEFKSVKKVR